MKLLRSQLEIEKSDYRGDSRLLFYKYVYTRNFIGKVKWDLWSNTDAVPGLATGNVQLEPVFTDNGTMTVTAVGSSFGIDTCGQVGDVIRFGADRGAGAGHTYFGDAVIVAVSL